MRTRHNGLPVAQLVLDLTPTGPEPACAPVGHMPTLSDADHEAIARYLVDMLRDGNVGPADRLTTPAPPTAVYVKAEQLMERYQVSMKFIRSHAVALGATRLSDAANSKLRYHLPTADAFIASHRKHPAGSPRSGNRRATEQRSRTPTGAPLVPFT